MMNGQTVKETVKKIVENWFYTEPLLFAVSERHVIARNENLPVPLRSGKRCVEYSPAVLRPFSEHKIEFLLKIEFVRILLGHPYSRLPPDANRGILFLASDAVIWQLHLKGGALKHADDADFFELAGVQYLRQRIGVHATFPDMNFEQWYNYIFDLVKKSENGENAGTSDSADTGLASLSAAAELWQEDKDARSDIQSALSDALSENASGSLGNSLVRELKQESDFSFNYRRALRCFRQKIISADRILTRMKPSRRYGFPAMGSRYDRKADILIAVDVSGSVSDEHFSHFVRAIKNFFFLGIIEKMELIFFDVNIKNTEPVPFKKKLSLNDFPGRGGTDFQPVMDFFYEHKSRYSGMIVFTDGEGRVPDAHGAGGSMLWIFDSRAHYEKQHRQIEKATGAHSTYLPF